MISEITNRCHEDPTGRCRILFIHQVGARGGAGIMLANILAAIDRKIYEPIVVCPDGDVVEQLREAGAEVRVAPRPIYQFSHYTGYTRFALHPSFLRHVYGMWRDRGFWERYIRRSGADIVCLNAMTLAPMARSARRAGAKVMCVVQETAVSGLLGLRTGWLYYVLSNWMDAVIFISHFDRDRARCRAPIVEVIPNWVDLSCFERTYSRDRARLELGISPDADVILMMGGIDALKGTLSLIRATSMLEGAKGMVVLVAGYSDPVDLRSLGSLHRFLHAWRRLFGVEYRQKVLRAIRRHGLQERIRFVGMQSEVSRLYAAADVLVFPATRPHQARPVLEAGAMAKPAIAPDFPQTREFIRNGVNGLTYRPADIKGLAGSIGRILADKETAHQMGENNYIQTCNEHNKTLNAARISAVFGMLRGKGIGDAQL